MGFLADELIDHRAAELAALYPDVLPEHREGYDRYLYGYRCASAMNAGIDVSAEEREAGRIYLSAFVSFALGCI